MPCFSVPMGELLTMVLIPDELLLQFRCTGSDSSNLQGGYAEQIDSLGLPITMTLESKGKKKEEKKASHLDAKAGSSPHVSARLNCLWHKLLR